MFQPPSDSWMLVERIQRESLVPGAAVLDLCTGSGILAIAAARHAPSSPIVAVDISRRATFAARVNALLNGVSVCVVRGDLFAPLAGRRFDLIISNPPYLPGPSEHASVRGAARAWEAGHDGRLFIDRICAQAVQHLSPGGVLLLVHSSVCGEDATLDALSAAGASATVVMRRRGPLGPLMRSRSKWLHQRGLLTDHEREELLVIRGTTSPQRRPSALRAA